MTTANEKKEPAQGEGGTDAVPPESDAGEGTGGGGGKIRTCAQSEL